MLNFVGRKQLSQSSLLVLFPSSNGIYPDIYLTLALFVISALLKMIIVVSTYLSSFEISHVLMTLAVLYSAKQSNNKYAHVYLVFAPSLFPNNFRVTQTCQWNLSRVNGTFFLYRKRSFTSKNVFLKKHRIVKPNA